MDKDQNQQPSFISAEQARIRWLKSLEAQQDRKRFFRSGFKTHDQSAGAFQRGGSYLVAARPGIGKTAFLLSLAYRQARMGVFSYFCNIEMSTEEMWTRLACIHDRTLTLRELLETELSPERIDFLTRLSQELLHFSPLFFEGSEFTTFAKVAKETIVPSSQSALFVDYIGLITMRGLGPQEKYWLVSETAKQLKLAARALDIPIIAAVQLNRKIEDRKEKSPNLADLRDSGELENHADAVFALTRDGDRLDVDILKNRRGPLGSYSLHFDGPRAAVEEFDEL
jgi:replicative DNA helicase